MKREVQKTGKLAKIIIFLMIVFGIIGLFLVPDLIWKLRNCFLKIPYVNILFEDDFKMNEYISQMLMVITCVITTSLSFIAYRLSKEIGKLNLDSEKVKKTYSAYRLHEYIRKNSKIIFKYKQGIMGLEGLSCDEEMYKCWEEVKTINGIRKINKDFFIDYNRQLGNIVSSAKDNNELKRKNGVDSYCGSYIDLCEDELVYINEMKKLMNVLDEIIRGEEHE